MKPKTQCSIEVCILAGGLSRRMGRDKSRLKLGRRTLLAHVRATTKTLGLPVRVIQRDLVTRCGPLGGIYTALKTTEADAVLFLACDMPFVGGRLLRAVLAHYARVDAALFTSFQRKPGFPFVLCRATLPVVTRQIQRGEFSMHALAMELKAGLFAPPVRLGTQLQNINTPEEWECAARHFAKQTQATRCVER